MSESVLSVSDGQEALDAVATQPPVLILLDLMMPDVNGFEVIFRLRDNPATQHIPVKRSPLNCL
ncbi:response regulator [Chloroflexi bacterium TSY]|nr:response regulator [Chloroflexi bacterium TSY]